MKAIVETSLLNRTNRSLEIFVEILSKITFCKNSGELRQCMKLVTQQYQTFNDYYEYGFGASHMWVKEIGHNERLIFVEL